MGNRIHLPYKLCGESVENPIDMLVEVHNHAEVTGLRQDFNDALKKIEDLHTWVDYYRSKWLLEPDSDIIETVKERIAHPKIVEIEIDDL